METVNIWDKLNIYRGKVSLLLVFIIFSSSLFAQSKRRDDINLPHYDERKIHYGFTIGINSTRFKPVHSSYYVNQDTVKAALAPRSLGFSLGFILNYKFADYFDLRLLPTVSFYERKINYTVGNKQPTQVEQSTESTFIELPLIAKYKSERRGNMRLYMVGGFKPGIEAGAKKKEKKQSELRTQNYDLTVEYGLGADIYYPLFKFAPEIRFSFGLLNLLNNDPNIYSQSLNRLSTNTVSLYLHFE